MPTVEPQRRAQRVERRRREENQRRMRAGWISLVAGSAIFVGKMATARLTHSTAVYSDAMESIVNVVAAGLLIASLRVAIQPADEDHPYGHGKVEFASAAFEGALIIVAALLIVSEAIGELISGPHPQHLDLGLGLLLLFAGANAALGAYLVRVGRRTESPALEADGRHVLADVYTSAGVVVGLGLVWATGWVLLDPLLAIGVALLIGAEGVRLVRQALDNLMDRADPALLERIPALLENDRRPSWIDVHGLRAFRSGRLHHVDFHMIVPRYFDVVRIHAQHEEIEQRLRQGLGPDADLIVHFDPCAPSFCVLCEMPECPIREAEPRGRAPLTLERATRPEMDDAPGTRAAPAGAPA